MPAIRKITGERFGRWIVVSYHGSSGQGAMWNCRCDCGTEKPVHASSLVHGKSVSCGCHRSELTRVRNRKHGHYVGGKHSPTYTSWRAMLRRCSDKNHKSYHLYGGKGISVCDRWRKFQNFLDDMGERPEGKTLDRIDGNGGYSKDNCRWITARQQANNMCKNHPLTYNGKTQTIAEWARELGIKDVTIRTRLFRGWPTERALSKF